MTAVHPMLPGIYARSEELVQVTRDRDRKRATDQGLADARRRDVEDLLGAQFAAGYPFLADGALDWQDLYRPLGEIAPGVEAGALTRVGETNTFYRRPVVAPGAATNKDRLGAFFALHDHTPRSAPGLLTLPSPLSLAAAAAGEAAPSAAAVTSAARAILRPILRAAPAHGVACIVLDEPLGLLGDAAAYGALGNGLAECALEVPVWLRLPFQDATPLSAHVAALPVSGVIVDLVATDLDAYLGAAPMRHAGLGLGVVDARSSLVEEVEPIVEAALAAAAHTRVATLVVAPNGDLQHVPEPIARQKVRALGDAAGIVRGKLGASA